MPSLEQKLNSIILSGKYDRNNPIQRKELVKICEDHIKNKVYPFILQFTLTMPSKNTWNGKWSGDDKLFAVVKNFGRAKKTIAKYRHLIGENFSYSFGDGWIVNISIKSITSFEARTVRRLSAGFCGYEWMIDSIINNGEIRNDH